MYYAARAQSIRRTFSENMAPYVSWSGLSKWIFQPCGSELGARFGIQMGPKSCATWHVFCLISMLPVMLDFRCSLGSDLVPSIQAERGGAQAHFLNSGWWSLRNVTSRNGPSPCWGGALRDEKNGCVDLRKRPDFQCLLRTCTWKHGTARILT